MIDPDKWQILKVEDKGGVFYVILSVFYGGYQLGDSWRRSSPIKGIEDTTDKYIIKTNSSEYHCYKKHEGLATLSQSIYNKMQEAAKEREDVKIDLIKIEDAYECIKNT